jgi:hypothetical protein
MNKTQKPAALNFRIAKNKIVTYAGPEYAGCFGSARPVISCFKRPGWLVGNRTATDIRVWFVAMTVPETLDSDARQTFDRTLFRTGYRKMRSFGKANDKIRVFYSRKSAVDAFTALVDQRKAENAAARDAITAARAAIANAPTEADRVNAIIAHADLLA